MFIGRPRTNSLAAKASGTPTGRQIADFSTFSREVANQQSSEFGYLMERPRSLRQRRVAASGRIDSEKTFATMHHEAGVSARTIQRWLRHSNLETTLRYLAGADEDSEKTRAQLNNTFSAFARNGSGSAVTCGAQCSDHTQGHEPDWGPVPNGSSLVTPFGSA